MISGCAVSPCKKFEDSKHKEVIIMKEKAIICAVLLFVLSLIILPIYFFGVADNNPSRFEVR